MSYPLSIIIPAKKEEDVIIQTLETLSRKIKTPHNIVVVNESDTTDHTDRQVQRYIKRHKNVSLIRSITHKNGGTFGSSLRRGIASTKKGCLLFVMADMCDEPEIIDKMYALVLDGWDVVCGSRYVKGGRKIGGPKLQSFFSWLVCQSLHVLTGIPTKDSSNAFKMYRKDVIRLSDIKPQSGVEASLSLIFHAYFRTAKITEIPTVWKGRTVGDSKFRLLQRAPHYARLYIWAILRSVVYRAGIF